MIKFWQLYIFFILITLGSCGEKPSRIPADVVNIPNSASGDPNLNQLPFIEFATLEHNFGKVIQGEVVSFSFKFRNTGKSDLIIANIATTCGCTASEYPKTPVKPGEENYIAVSFNSAGKEGFQSKTLEVAANTQPSNTVLTVQAMVFTPEK